MGFLVTELSLSHHVPVSNLDGFFVCHGCSLWERDLFLCLSEKSHTIGILTQKLWYIPRSIAYFFKQLDSLACGCPRSAEAATTRLMIKDLLAYY